MKIVYVFILACALSKSAAADDLSLNVQYRLGSNNKEVYVFNGKIKSLVRKCLFKEPIEDVMLSSDGLALIVSPTGYVQTAVLASCSEDNPLSVSHIPSNVGTLADINLSKNVYVALDVIGVQPLSYAATVARIGSSRNLVNLPGAYVRNWPLNKLQRFGFQQGPDYRLQRISRDGRYVAVSGEVRCDDEAFPGVWDIGSKKKVVLSSEKYSEDERDNECKKLFGRRQ